MPSEITLSFCLTYLKNSTLNVTLEQLRRLLKEEPETNCELLYKHSKVYRLLVVVWDAQTLFGNFKDKMTVWMWETSLKDYNSSSLEIFDLQIITPSTQLCRVGMLNENGDIVFDFEGFTYKNLIFKEQKVKRKIFRNTVLCTPPKNCLTVPLHNDSQNICTQKALMVFTRTLVLTLTASKTKVLFAFEIVFTN